MRSRSNKSILSTDRLYRRLLQDHWAVNKSDCFGGSNGRFFAHVVLGAESVRSGRYDKTDLAGHLKSVSHVAVHTRCFLWTTLWLFSWRIEKDQQCIYVNSKVPVGKIQCPLPAPDQQNSFTLASITIPLY